MSKTKKKPDETNPHPDAAPSREEAIKHVEPDNSGTPVSDRDAHDFDAFQAGSAPPEDGPHDAPPKGAPYGPGSWYRIGLVVFAGLILLVIFLSMFD